MTLVMGVDSSTQSCKILVTDAATGAVVRTGRASHPDGTEVDPEVQEALEAARVPELSVPTLNEGESYDDFLADRSAYEDFDPSVYLGGKGFGFVRLQQLATEHLLGARG